MVSRQNFATIIIRYALQLVCDFEIYKHVLMQVLKMWLIWSIKIQEQK